MLLGDRVSLKWNLQQNCCHIELNGYFSLLEPLVTSLCGRPFSMRWLHVCVSLGIDQIYILEAMDIIMCVLIFSFDQYHKDFESG